MLISLSVFKERQAHARELVQSILCGVLGSIIALR
jgi:hypothetical protein